MNGKCAASLIAAGLLAVSPALDAMTDQELAAKVRQLIEDDPALSSVAGRLKISVENGKATLKGSVDTEQEREEVERRATVAAGPGNITDDIVIKAARAKRKK